MSNDADACVPQTLTDFVFDLYDSVTTSQLSEEQTKFYITDFRDLSAKYFASSPWPSPESIASECNGDPLFLALYRELTHRHWHSVSRPSVRDRMEGWDVYRELFDEILEDAENGGHQTSGSNPPKFFLLPQWTFDILHEFVYQFQGFCQVRTTLHANAIKHGVLGEPTPDGEPTINTSAKAPHHVIENVSVLAQQQQQGGGGTEGAWAVETVLYYLQRLVAIGTSSECNVPAYQYLGIFASVSLSRLECLVSDYTGSLQAISPIYESPMIVSKVDGAGVVETKTSLEVVHSVFAARLSLTYHAAISFLMLRRYKDAVSILSEICAYMQRGFKTGQLRKLPNSDQLFKNYDRMIALLAICTHICPQAPIEESISKTIREKHGALLSSKDSYNDLLVHCAPKFVTPAIPDFCETSMPAENAYKIQLTLLDDELSCQSSFRKLRSYLKLYTSLPVTKLTSFGGVDEMLVLSLKLKFRQLESNTPGIPSLRDASPKSALDIHYYLEDDTVHVDEAEKQRRFENYFMAQITQNYEIRKDVQAISTSV